jgi:hypothetical protein
LRAASIEDNVLALKKDVTEDGEANARVGLDTTVAGAGSGGRKVDVVARNSGSVVTNSDGEVRDISVTVEDVATLAVVVLGAVDGVIVGLNDIVVKENKSSTGV